MPQVQHSESQSPMILISKCTNFIINPDRIPEGKAAAKKTNICTNILHPKARYEWIHIISSFRIFVTLLQEKSRVVCHARWAYSDKEESIVLQIAEALTNVMLLMQTRYALRLASEEHWRVPNYYSCILGGSLFFLLDTRQNKTSSVSLGEKKVVLTLWFCERPEKHVWESTVLCYIQGMKVSVQQWASGCHLVEAKCGIWSEFCFFQWKQGGDLQHFFLCSISEGCYYQ